MHYYYNGEFIILQVEFFIFKMISISPGLYFPDFYFSDFYFSDSCYSILSEPIGSVSIQILWLIPFRLIYFCPSFSHIRLEFRFFLIINRIFLPEILPSFHLCSPVFRTRRWMTATPPTKAPPSKQCGFPGFSFPASFVFLLNFYIYFYLSIQFIYFSVPLTSPYLFISIFLPAQSPLLMLPPHSSHSSCPLQSPRYFPG